MFTASHAAQKHWNLICNVNGHHYTIYAPVTISFWCVYMPFLHQRQAGTIWKMLTASYCLYLFIWHAYPMPCLRLPRSESEVSTPAKSYALSRQVKCKCSIRILVVQGNKLLTTFAFPKSYDRIELVHHVFFQRKFVAKCFVVTFLRGQNQFQVWEGFRLLVKVHFGLRSIFGQNPY